MVSDSNPVREHYGLYTAKINHEIQRVELTLKRYREKVLDETVEKLHEWAVSRIEERYPDYEVIDNGTR